MPAANETTILELPYEEIPNLAQTILARFGYQSPLTDDETHHIQAEMRENYRIMNGHSGKRFIISITWNPVDADELIASAQLAHYDRNYFQSKKQLTAINVSVSETNTSWAQQHCEIQAKGIIAEFHNLTGTWNFNRQLRASDTRFGSSSWATKLELEAKEFLHTKFPKDHLLIGRDIEKNSIALPPKFAEMHTLLCGPTGTGKTTSFLIPNLIQRLLSSAIVTEATAGPADEPHLFTATAALREYAGGQKVYYFNPSDSTSFKINPIQHIKSLHQAQDMVDILIRNTTLKSHSGDQIWENAERQLLAALVLQAAAQHGHLAQVRSWLTEGPDALRPFMDNSPVVQARSEYAGFMNTSTEGFRMGVCVSLLVRLTPWTNPYVAKLTETSDVPFEDLHNQLFTFYMSVPANRRSMKPVSAFIFNFVLDQVLANLDKLKHPLTLYLDELTNFGYIPDLPAQLSILRHAKIPIVLGFQNYSQLLKTYGPPDTSAITSQPGTKIFYAQTDINIAREISSFAGTRTESKRKAVSSGRGFREQVYALRLLNESDIRSMPQGRAVVFMPFTNPIVTHTINPKEHEHLTKVPPTKRPPIVLDDSIVDMCHKETDKAMVKNVAKKYPEIVDPKRNKATRDDFERATWKRGKKWERRQFTELYRLMNQGREDDRSPL